ncbi:TcaA NTF2-like domain-containing protein [Tepidibacter formicigenes]|jgi:hypothetical protein|uniref:TcaA protein NTF2-like domain-containing protein n=1 Tax=Tepidibacter formicigenes DSM 15518 TaxID=1123349 RepID=A0A1M6SJ27_9FIRM|nr:hypothetical protein [Tepidibacter formicigenes]SHK44705.1 hypothetical protein SAMN02744037_02355 [Tepidibacter formicigenes DSM 15518]
MSNKNLYNKYIFLLSVTVIIVLIGFSIIQFNINSVKKEVYNISSNTKNKENSNVYSKEDNIDEKNTELTNTYIQNNITDLIKDYENAMVESINTNDFSIVEPYLISNSNLYNLQKALVSNLYKRGIKEKLLDVQVENTEFINGVYNVYVYEKFNITYGKKGSKVKEFNYIYEVKENNGKLGLSDIFSNEEKINTNLESIEKQSQVDYNNEVYYKSSKEYYSANINEIYKNPSKYIGEKIELSGTIIYIKENFNSENMLISNGKNIFHVYAYKTVKHFKGDKIIVYGKIIGETNEYNINNSKTTIPSIYGEYIYLSKPYK